VGKGIASLSVDLDNLWTYLKVHGDAEWVDLPSYLPLAVPIILDVLARRELKITFFVVGRDAERAGNREALRSIAEVGHEIGNHSLNHEPWMQSYPREKVEEEIAGAEERIVAATGRKPLGFRGPGYARSAVMLEVLCTRGYVYDTSMLPSVLGPLARLYYFRGAGLSKEKRAERGALFGRVSDGFQPLRPFVWRSEGRELVETPVTTVPLLRVPFHLSYLIWLSRFSPAVAMGYLRFAIGLCRARGVEPCYLLHPLDFLGKEDCPELGFFPGMDLPRARKLAMVEAFLDLYTRVFEVAPIVEHVRRMRARGLLRGRAKDVVV
jgi:hypothetical protein